MLVLPFADPAVAEEQPWGVSAGIGGSQGDPGLSVHGGASRPLLPWLAVDLTATVRPPHDPLTNLDRALLAIAAEVNSDTTLQQPVLTAEGGLGLWARFGWTLRPPGSEFWGAAGARLGAEAVLLTRGVATLNPAYLEGNSTEPARYAVRDTIPVLAPSAGFCLDVWYRRFGVRFAVHDRWWVMEEPDYGNYLQSGQPEPLGNMLYSTPTSALSLMVEL